MYQIKCTGGYEIQVIGKGDSLSRIVDSNGQIRFTGKHSECEKWLRDRGIRMTYHGSHSDNK